MVKVLAQRPTHISAAVATVLLITKREREAHNHVSGVESVFSMWWVSTSRKALEYRRRSSNKTKARKLTSFFSFRKGFLIVQRSSQLSVL